jgi:helix-turn-helix, Psq domain
MAEAKINLAIQAIKQDQFQSVRHAAVTYDVPRTSLRRRRAGILPKRDYKPKLKKLTKLKETVIYNYIIDLDERGFAPTLNAVRAIADRLLSKRGGRPVGINWPATFVNRTPRIKTHIN